jgi:hypothetical protein
MYVRQVKKWSITIAERSMAVVIMDHSSTGIVSPIPFAAHYIYISGLFSVILSFVGSGLAMGRYHIQVEGPDPLQLKKKRPKRNNRRFKTQVT